MWLKFSQLHMKWIWMLVEGCQIMSLVWSVLAGRQSVDKLTTEHEHNNSQTWRPDHLPPKMDTSQWHLLFWNTKKWYQSKKETIKVSHLLLYLSLKTVRFQSQFLQRFSNMNEMECGGFRTSRQGHFFYTSHIKVSGAVHLKMTVIQYEGWRNDEMIRFWYLLILSPLTISFLFCFLQAIKALPF